MYVCMPANTGPDTVTQFNTILPPVKPVARSILQLGQTEY